MKGRRLCLFAIVILALLLLQPKYYIIHSKRTLSSQERNELAVLGVQSIFTLDVPVSSLVIYKGKIIGKGYNTVNRDTTIAGHAELNAISDAMKSVGGMKAFDMLNRDSLELLTTFEPCLMCRGAIIEHRIKHVAFVKEKSLTDWWKLYARNILYEWRKTKIAETELQDSLFRLHPAYKEK